MTNGFRLDPTPQAIAIVMLDCITKLNGMGLTRSQYLHEWQRMMYERIGEKASLDKLNSLLDEWEDKS